MLLPNERKISQASIIIICDVEEMLLDIEGEISMIK
jgi:hypothetical protein